MGRTGIKSRQSHAVSKNEDEPTDRTEIDKRCDPDQLFDIELNIGENDKG